MPYAICDGSFLGGYYLPLEEGTRLKTTDFVYFDTEAYCEGAMCVY